MEKSKYWNFSRQERVAIIILAIVITCILVFSAFPDKTREEANIKEYNEEINNFNQHLSDQPIHIKKEKKRDKKKKKKNETIYHPQEQTLAPKEHETDN
ncbi:MAG: hypothetical protein RR293_05470 [Bacteroidales bacterium]